MQIKNKLTDLLVVVIFIAFISASYSLYNQRKEKKTLYTKNLILKANYETFQKVVSRNQEAILFSDYVSIDSNSRIGRYIDNKIKKYSCELLKNKIALFVPEKACNVCYDEVYDALQYANDSVKVDVVIITGESKYNETRNIINDLGISSQVYSLDDDIFWNSMDIVYAPFFSFVDNNLQCRHCFVPYPNHPRYSYEYLKHIIQRYFRH